MFGLHCRNYDENQRKRAARQIRDLINAAKQGEAISKSVLQE